MSSFVPMNVEIEEDSEDELDDSKEIQIEEALKLYQNALKLHSQGPAFYEAAEIAYNELFKSEIFTWEESLSEAQALERYDGIQDSDDDAEDASNPVLNVSADAVDGAPSSLPQILYLAHKNRGQFQLDQLRDSLSRIEYEIRSGVPNVTHEKISNVARSSLKLFVEALDRDETDLELWRLVSKIGGFLGSQRLARFSLEAVLDDDDGISESLVEPSGLEVGFAKEQLKPLLEALDDQLSQSQVSSFYSKGRSIIPSFRERLDPCPYLHALPVSRNTSPVTVKATPHLIRVPLRSFACCGKAILFQLDQEAPGIDNPDPGATYSIVMPPHDPDTMPAPSRNSVDGDLISNREQPQVIDDRGALKDASKLNDGATDVVRQGLPGKPLGLSPNAPNQTRVEEVTESPTKIDGSEAPGGENLDIVDGGKRAEPIPAGVDPMISGPLPTRKRSSETAELPDSIDGGRLRSKRIKAKGSLDPDTVKDSTAEDWARWYEQQLQIYHQADNSAFESINTILSKLGSNVSTSLINLRELVSNQSLNVDLDLMSKPSEALGPVAQDLKGTLDAWDLGRSKAFLNGFDAKDPAGGASSGHGPGFAAFLENSGQSHRRLSKSSTLYLDHDPYPVADFVNEINSEEWIGLDQLAYRWLEKLIGFPSYVKDEEAIAWYEKYLWPDLLKESVVQMLVFQDEAIYSQLNRLIEETERADSKPTGPYLRRTISEGHSVLWSYVDGDKRKYTNMTQTIFEIHLDVYGRITNPSSKVDEATRVLQRDRLSRWAALASKLANQWSWLGNGYGSYNKASDDLHVRFIWASVVCNSLLEPTFRENTILCYQDLVRLLKLRDAKYAKRGPFNIQLPNNAIMPEISVEAAEKEISRLTTMDFFMGVLNPENTDPLTTIESLEPLLDLSIQPHNTLTDEDREIGATDAATMIGRAENSWQASEVLDGASPDPKLVEALSFFNQGSVPLRLFLWQKLRDAYRAIAYPPQVVACDLRMVALIVDHLSSSSYQDNSQEVRRDGLLRWLHRLDDHLTRVLSTALTKHDAFDCLDSNHVRTSLEALTSFQKLLHVFALWEDTIRVGKIPAPAQVTSQGTRGLVRATDKFRDMIVKTWTLQYLILKEMLAQHADFFGSPSQELLKHLERVHQALGLRCYCSLANKTFLRLMKKEIETFKVTEGLDIDMSQLMYDLYGVKISSNATEMQDHGCSTENLDRSTALEIMDLVITQVNSISTKDLLKSDLKLTVDKMQQVIMVPKNTNSTVRTFNLRLINNFLKSPLNPRDLYRSVRGIGGLCGTLSHDEGFDIAAKGWYFQLGHIALAKFRSLKRSSPGSIDDLLISKTFLKHDLEFDTDRWETWYRLGQVYDAMIEEDATWTADKLDNHMDDLADLQRKAIHCYSMALAVASRCAEGSFEDARKMGDLCAEFGTRIYASTREPFAMKAFSLDDYKRHYNSREAGMYQGVPFQGMRLYSAWKLASILLRRASAQKPHNWVISFNFGKVLWKMHNCEVKVLGTAERISFQPAIDAFTRAIEACPEKRDNKHPDKDPVLEPHYKLLSVVHKLVRSKRLLPEGGRRILQVTPYARKAPDFQDDEGWTGYVWQILKSLRAADKANWHHRMVARAAHIMYDDEPNDRRSAVGARNELSQQIFTKSMSIQVWRPDNERPGRHFVYTGRYVRFFTRLLYQLNDKTSLEALARRIRKRTGEFVDHGSVWEEVCRAYLKLLHHQPYSTVTDGFSEAVFQGMDPDGFQAHSARLEAHVHALQNPPPLLDILREAIELKKLNNNLFRPINPFEDLIRDVYAHLYDSIIPGLIKNDAVEENRVRMRVDNILSNPMPSMVETPPPEGFVGPGGEQPKRSGARYVTAREIVRKAEAIAAKPAPTVPAKIFKALAPAPTSEMGIRPPSDAPRLAVVVNNEGANDAGSSVPGSVHDSADDESELSEVDDEVADAEPEPEPEEEEDEETRAQQTRTPLFPRLIGQTEMDLHEAEDGTDDEEPVQGEESDERMEGDDEVEERVEEEEDANIGGMQEEELEDDGAEDIGEGEAKAGAVHEGNW